MSIIRTIKRLWSKRSSEAYIDWMRSEECRIGKGTKIFARPSVVFVDTTRPWLIDIGENVQITGGENLNAWLRLVSPKRNIW